MLALGPHAVEELLAAAPHAVARLEVAVGPTQRRLAELLARAGQFGVPVATRSPRELDELAGGRRHQGLVAHVKPYRYATLDDLLRAAPAPLLVALDEVTDPHNLGAIVRSAVALGADGLILPERRAAQVTPTVLRTSAGAVAHARIARVVNLARTLRELREGGLHVVGLDASGTEKLHEVLGQPARDGRVLVVGSEGRGLRRLVREACETLAAIDLPGPVASLNASVAAAIAIYEATRAAGG